MCAKRRISASAPWRDGSVGTLFLVLLSACASDERNSLRAVAPAWTSATPDVALHPVDIVRPTSAGGLDTRDLEITGTPASIACVTCHGPGAGEAFTRRPDAPEGFHDHVEVLHGDLVCGSCHQPGRPQQLHTAAGDRLAIEEAMTLCSQCHGPQRRNYDHGAHGGMRGYWDLQRGPRQRNDCVTCHAPHAPAYPKVTPMPGPKDRFASPRAHPGSLVEMRYGANARDLDAPAHGAHGEDRAR